MTKDQDDAIQKRYDDCVQGWEPNNGQICDVCGQAWDCVYPIEDSPDPDLVICAFCKWVQGRQNDR